MCEEKSHKFNYVNSYGSIKMSETHRSLHVLQIVYTGKLGMVYDLRCSKESIIKGSTIDKKKHLCSATKSGSFYK